MATRILKHVDRSATTHRRSRWGDYYSGTKEALIAAGHAKDGQFPGDPGCGKTRCSFDAQGKLLGRGCSRGRVLSVDRQGRHRFVVCVYIDNEERERREAEEEKAEQSRKEAHALEAEIAKARAELAELPATSEAFALKAAEFFWTVYNVFWREYVGRDRRHESGFRFTRDSRDTIEDMASGLYAEILDAESTYDERHRTKRLMEARAKAAKLDAPLQRLLSNATSLRGRLA